MAEDVLVAAFTRRITDIVERELAHVGGAVGVSLLTMLLATLMGRLVGRSHVLFTDLTIVEGGYNVLERRVGVGGEWIACHLGCL